MKLNYFKCILLLFGFIFANFLRAQSGVFESSLILNPGVGNAAYDLQASTANLDFNNHDFGAFQSTDTFILNGAENKTFKCGSDNIINGWLYYRIYLTSSSAPAYNSIAIPYGSDDATNLYCSGLSNDQTWLLNSASINILNGLASGLYYLEVYSSADYTFSTGSDTHTANNSGANYKAIFQVCDITSGPIFDAAPSNLNISCGQAAPAMISLSWNDDCDGTGSLIGSDNSTQTNNGSCSDYNFTITRTWTYTDSDGITGSTSQLIIVEDTTIPTLAGQGANANVECTDALVFIAPTASDNCDASPNITFADNTTTNACGLDTVTRTWTATDCTGNVSATVSQTLTYVDTVSPIITGTITDTYIEGCSASDVPAALTSIAGLETLNGSLSILDACSSDNNLTVNSSDNVAGSLPFTITRTYTVTDQCNNTSVAFIHIIFINDTTNPISSTLPVLNGQCDYTITSAPTINDTCSGTITGTTSQSLPISFNSQGAHIVTWNFNDGHGNDININQTIVIDDDQAPVISCQDITVQIDNTGTAMITPNQIVASVSDNCNYTLSLDKDTFDCTNIGSNIITVTATDDNNNTAICTAIVTITSPTINGGVLLGHLSNFTPAPADSNVIEVTACPDEPQNALLTLNGQTGSIYGYETSIDGGVTWSTSLTTNNTFTINDVLETTLVRARIIIGACEARSNIVYIAVIPPDIPPTIIGPDSFVVCMGEDVTVEAQSEFGINPDFNNGGLFNTANLNNLGWLVDGIAVWEAGNNNTNPSPWRGTTGPKKYTNRCYDNFDGKFTVAHGINATTTLETPIFNTLGLSQATLEFDQAFNFTAGASGAIMLSLDDGATYPITLDPGPGVNYTGPSDTGFMIQNMSGNKCDNTLSSFVDDHVIIDLQNYIGRVGLRIKIIFNSNVTSSWAIDNITIPQAPVDEVLEWTDASGVVVTTGATTVITPVTPGVQTYGVTSLINGCRAEGNEGTEFVSVSASLSYAGEDIDTVLGECGELTVSLNAYDNNLSALDNVANGAWDPTYQIPQQVVGDHDNNPNTPNQLFYPTNYPGTGESGYWEIDSATTCDGGGSFSNINSPNATFVGDPGTYTLKWTVDGCPSFITVTVSSCEYVNFDGADDYVDFKNEYGLSSNEFSIEAWVKPNSVSGTQSIISKRDANNLNSGYDLRMTNNILSFNWNNGGTLNSAPHTLNTNRWYHVAVTFGSGTYKLYVDGLLIKTSNGSFPVTNSRNCLLGAMDQTGNPPNKPVSHFNGWMDEIRFWNKELAAAQIHHMMNQEITANGGAITGEVISLDIPNLSWTDLDGYYRMDVACSALSPYAGSIKGKLKNINLPQEETAPIPYTSSSNGVWTTDGIWTHANVWDIPNSNGINNAPIDWNIVRTAHDISSGNKDITLLGLLIDANELSFEDPGTAKDETNDGQMLWVTRYLKLDGKLDLVGESQLIQKRYNLTYLGESIFDNTSTGYAERDQQGTSNPFNYNYWGSPFASNNAASNNVNSYSIDGVLRDGSITVVNPLDRNINWTAARTSTGGSPTQLSTRWLYTYTNKTGNTYSEWDYLGNSGTLNIGLGFTMKGSGNATPVQNYVFVGIPNNGTIINTIGNSANPNLPNEILLGNPYPSAFDANEFIKDNIPLQNPDGSSSQANSTSSESIHGELYFWEHYDSNNTHVLADYEGGYATYTLAGGVKASTPLITEDGVVIIGGAGSKVPERFVPVGQGFFIKGSPNGGTVTFENDQRAFQREVSANGNGSIFFEYNDDSNLMKNELIPDQKFSKTEELMKKIRIDFTSPKGITRHLLLSFTPNNEATDDFDYGYDAINSDSYPSDMSWSINNNNYIIQGVGEFDISKKYPFNLNLAISGNIEINLSTQENFDSEIPVFIYDTLLNTYTKFNTNNFSLPLNAGDYSNRFFLTFENKDTLNTNTNSISSIRVYYLQDTHEIYINWVNSDDINKVELLNLLGQKIKVWTDITTLNQREIKIPVSNVSDGNYILKVTNSQGKTSSKKVIIKM